MPSLGKFQESLEKFNVDEKIISQINEGYGIVDSKIPKKERALYFKRAVDIMNVSIESANLSLEEKLELIKDVPDMGRPVRNEDGTITIHAVYYSDGEKYLCACSNFNGIKREYSVSRNYCFCCAGHFKYHYEIMLGVKLKTLEVLSSPLDSDGKNPCIMKYEIL